MRIALCSTDLRMTKNLLHLVKTTTSVDLKRRKTVPQVVDPDITQPGRFTRSIPGVIETHVRLKGLRVGKDETSALESRHFLQKLVGGLGDR